MPEPSGCTATSGPVSVMAGSAGGTTSTGGGANGTAAWNQLIEATGSTGMAIGIGASTGSAAAASDGPASATGGGGGRSGLDFLGDIDFEPAAPECAFPIWLVRVPPVLR